MVLLVPYRTVANVTRLEGELLLYPSIAALSSSDCNLISLPPYLTAAHPGDAMVSLLKTPMLSNGNPLTILALPNYGGLMAYLPRDSRMEVAVLAARIMNSSKVISQSHVRYCISFTRHQLDEASVG